MKSRNEKYMQKYDKTMKLSPEQKKVLSRLCLIMFLSHFIVACLSFPWMILTSTVAADILYFFMTAAYTVIDAFCLTVIADMLMRRDRKMTFRCTAIYTGAQALSSLIISGLDNFDTMFNTHELDFIILSTLMDVLVEVVYITVFLGVFFCALYLILRRTSFSLGRRRSSILIGILFLLSLFSDEMFDTILFFSQVGSSATTNEIVYIIMTYLLYGIFAVVAWIVSSSSYNFSDKYMSIPDYVSKK